MGFFTNKKTKQVFKTGATSDGTITGPIGTPIHNTAQEDKIRLLTRITDRNQKIKESHEEKIRRQKLAKAEFDKKENQRREQQEAIIDEIETRRRVLQQAKKDPRVLDQLRKASAKGGKLPEGFRQEQEKKKKQFLQEETAKINGLKESAKGDINRAKEAIDKNESEVVEIKRKIEELKSSSSNIPEINHENTRTINELTMQVAELEKINDAFEDDVERGVNEVKRLEKESDRLGFLHKDTAFGTVGDLPDHKETLPIPDDQQKARERAKKSTEVKKLGKGIAPTFPEGFQHKRRFRDPITGEQRYTSRISKNKKFSGFDEEGEPVFVDKEERKERHEPTERIEEPTHRDETSKAQSIRIIPGLAKRDEE